MIKKNTFINSAVFILFFGIALIKAVQEHDWLEASLFAMLGVLSLWGDIYKK